MVYIDIHGGKVASFQDEEWEMVKTFIEDCLSFYSGVIEIFGEHPGDFPSEIGNKKNFEELNSQKGKSVLQKLRHLGIDTKGL